MNKMKTTTHTPGPWRCNYGNGTNLSHDATIWGDNEKVAIAEIVIDDQFSTAKSAAEAHQTAVANARLIAAAPELLAALTNLVDWAAQIDIQSGMNRPGALRNYEKAILDAREVIAKAKGQP